MATVNRLTDEMVFNFFNTPVTFLINDGPLRNTYVVEAQEFLNAIETVDSLICFYEHVCDKAMCIDDELDIYWCNNGPEYDRKLAIIDAWCDFEDLVRERVEATVVAEGFVDKNGSPDYPAFRKKHGYTNRLRPEES